MDLFNKSLDIFEIESKRLIRDLHTRQRRSVFRILITPLVIIAIIFGTTIFARADVAYFYSPLCLGSWRATHHAEGQAEVSSDGDISEFTEGNSSVLYNSSGQIFCGRFQSDAPPDKQIQHVRLRLSLGVAQPQIQEIPVQDFENGATLDTPADQPIIFVVPQNPVDISSPTDTPTDTPEPTPIPEEATPLVTPEETSIPTPSTVDTGPSAWLKSLIPIAHAAEATDNLDDILEVRYTLNGVDWQSLGHVNRTQWRNISFDLPIDSIDQITGLQIAINSLPTFDATMTVYLDSMWIEAEYDSSAITMVKEIASTVIDAVTLKPLTDLLPMTSNDPAPADTPIIKKITTYSLQLNGTPQEAQRSLPWHTDKELELVTSTSSAAHRVQVSERQGGLEISGPCREKYYVIAVFKDASDYIQHPGTAVYNSASPCSGSDFTYTLKDWPAIDAGTYYLLVGEQAIGSWVPLSNVYPIQVDKKEVEVKQ